MTADQQDIKNPSLRCNLDPAKAKDLSFVMSSVKDFDHVFINPPEGKSFAGGLKYSRVSFRVDLTGDMEGWALHNNVMTLSGCDEKAFNNMMDKAKAGECDGHVGRCDWAGQSVFTGTILGRKGSIAIAQWGTCLGKSNTIHWALLDETATDELVGIKGGGSFEVEAKPDIDQPGKIKVQFA